MLKQLEKLDKYHVILASQSPRRKMLLEKLDIKFEVRTYRYYETLPPQIDPCDVAECIALQKALYVPKDELPKNFLLITADTIVVIDGEILGKPKDEKEAVTMLEKLSGKRHEVMTGVVITTENVVKNFTEKSEVWFKDLTKTEIENYVREYQPLDKAGAYGAQDAEAEIIDRIEGSYFNVIGLPIGRVMEELLGIEF